VQVAINKAFQDVEKVHKSDVKHEISYVYLLYILIFSVYYEYYFKFTYKFSKYKLD